MIVSQTAKLYLNRLKLNFPRIEFSDIEILQMSTAFVSSILSAYLFLVFIFSSELRSQQNFPIFLTNFVDLVAVGPGLLGNFLVTQTIQQHDPHRQEAFTDNSFWRYTQLRNKVRKILWEQIVYKVNFFWWRCLPLFLKMRVNEYGLGICALIIAYERYGT